MEDKDYTGILNNAKDLTLLQIIKTIPRLKYRTIITFLTFFATLIGGSFAAGKYSHQKQTAVMLESPFAMRITVDNVNHDFTSLTLTKDPSMLPPAEDRVVLSLREIKSAFDIIPVGKVVAQVEENKITGFWSIILSSVPSPVEEANARPNASFDWNGHQNDYKFKESFISEDTVNRYYSDGCVLEYKVDRNRRSIPSSFRWISKSH